MPFFDQDDDFAGVKPGTVFMFPGQGAQVVGMGAEAAASVPAAAALYKSASEILGYDLLAIDDKAQLDKTDVSQPAIFVASMAAVEKLRAEDAAVVDACNMAMGLSLGEYTALCFAGAISFEDQPAEKSLLEQTLEKREKRLQHLHGLTLVLAQGRKLENSGGEK